MAFESNYAFPGYSPTSKAQTSQELIQQEFEDKFLRKRLSELYGVKDSQPSSLDKFAAMLSGSSGGGSSSSSGYSSAPQNYYENRLRSLMDNPNSIADTGAYKFAFNQGQQALERSAAAKGMTGSGNVLAELANYGQGMASQQYGYEANRLAAMSGQTNQFTLGKQQNQIARDDSNIKKVMALSDIMEKQPKVYSGGQWHYS